MQARHCGIQVGVFCRPLVQHALPAIQRVGVDETVTGNKTWGSKRVQPKACKREKSGYNNAISPRRIHRRHALPQQQQHKRWNYEVDRAVVQVEDLQRRLVRQEPVLHFRFPQKVQLAFPVNDGVGVVVSRAFASQKRTDDFIRAVGNGKDNYFEPATPSFAVSPRMI